MTARTRKRGRRPKQAKPDLVDLDSDIPPLRECVRRSLRAYFRNLDGHSTAEVYELVLSEIEAPLLEVVLTEVRGNLSRASAVLGLNRATLRKKLRKYGLEKNGDAGA